MQSAYPSGTEKDDSFALTIRRLPETQPSSLSGGRKACAVFFKQEKPYIVGDDCNREDLTGERVERGGGGSH